MFDTAHSRYLEWNQVEDIANDLGIETVPILYKGPWKEDKSLFAFAEGKSTIGDCCREGFVMRSVPNAFDPCFDEYGGKRGHALTRKIVKLKGMDYQLFMAKKR